jgi:hypothetical protein
MQDPDATAPIDPTETVSTETPRSDPVMDEELNSAELDLDAVGAVLEALDRDDLDRAEEIVTGLDAGGAEPV